MHLLKIIREYIRRIIRNYKIYSITILGMSIAIIASFHIYFFVAKEYSVDGFHQNKKEIYRVVETSKFSNLRNVSMPFPFGKAIREAYPEVTNYARFISRTYSYKLAHKGKAKETVFQFSDPSFFEMFSFPLIEGSLENYKNNPKGVLLTEQRAKELFPNQKAIGKTLTVSKENYKTKKVTSWVLEVVGVLKNIPKTSTIQGTMFVNVEFYFLSNLDKFNRGWNYSSPKLYLQIPKLKDKKEFDEKITDVFIKNFNLNNDVRWHIKEKDKPFYKLQRLDKIYFTSLDIEEQKVKGSKQFVNVLWLVGLLTLFLATTNYIIMNLGLNVSRVQEFNARRYLGASKANIFLQLSIESLFNVTLCFVVALLTYSFFSNSFSSLLGFSYQLNYTTDINIILSFFALLLCIGLITGLLQFSILYSAVFSTSKGTQKINFSVGNIIKVFIGLQLFLFISIISVALLVQKQNSFLQKKDLGFNFKNVISVFAGFDKDGIEFVDLMKGKSYVKEIANGVMLFNEESRLRKYTIDNTANKISASKILADKNYVKIHGIELLQGRNFNSIDGYRMTWEQRTTRPKSMKYVEVIANEEFVRKSGLKNPVGTLLNDGYYQIVGIFKDVYNMPLYNPIVPTLIGYEFSGATGEFQILYEPKYKKELLKDINDFLTKKGINKEHFKEIIKEFNYKEVYKKEVQLKNLLELFTVIVLVIAILGLIAISLFMTQNRTKEIGIRKINGATTTEILKLLNKNFIVWVAIAFVFAVPVSYIVLQKWLQNFAYKTSMSWWVFAVAGIIVLFISLLAVSWQTYKAATQNPVESLQDD